jgi:hypothetical protein
MKSISHSYVFTPLAVPGNWQAAAEQRLRCLLKVALRAFGFRREVCRLNAGPPGRGAKPPRNPKSEP